MVCECGYFNTKIDYQNASKVFVCVSETPHLAGLCCCDQIARNQWKCKKHKRRVFELQNVLRNILRDFDKSIQPCSMGGILPLGIDYKTYRSQLLAMPLVKVRTHQPILKWCPFKLDDTILTLKDLLVRYHTESKNGNRIIHSLTKPQFIQPVGSSLFFFVSKSPHLLIRYSVQLDTLEIIPSLLFYSPYNRDDSSTLQLTFQTEGVVLVTHDIYITANTEVNAILPITSTKRDLIGDLPLDVCVCATVKWKTP